MTLHESRAEPRIKFICEYKSESESDISCDFTQLKAEDPVLLSPISSSSNTHLRSIYYSYWQVHQLSISTVSHSFMLNIPENPYRHTAPCAVLLFGCSASPYYCCLCKSLTKVTVRLSRTTKISCPMIKTSNHGQDLSSTLNSVL